MGVTEIILIIVGAVVLIVSFIVPAGRSEGRAAQAPAIDEKTVRNMLEKEIEGKRNHIGDMVDETLNYSMEKTERAMERLANEKIMAINEYSEQVLAAINKNHQEVMFLYDMLNDKHKNLVNTVSEASKRAKEIQQTVRDAEITVKEAVETAGEDTDSMAVNGESAGHASGSRAERQVPENTETGETAAGNEESTEFLPIMPPRAEPVQGAINEKDTSAGAVRKESAQAEEPEDGKNNNERILRLHKLGKSKTAIAKELGLGVGEVKLVIDLFEQ